MPAYVVYRPSVMRSGRLLARVAAVAALLTAAAVAFIVITHTGGARARSAARHPTTAAAGAGAARTKLAAAQVARVARARTAARTKAAAAKTPPAKTRVETVTKPRSPAVPAPATTPVAVLNGGTAHGAAAALAARLRSLGYPVPIVGNAGRHDLPMAIEYSKGLGRAARALAHHVGQVQYVTPLEGPNRNLSGARLLVILGD